MLHPNPETNEEWAENVQDLIGRYLNESGINRREAAVIKEVLVYFGPPPERVTVRYTTQRDRW